MSKKYIDFSAGGKVQKNSQHSSEKLQPPKQGTVNISQSSKNIQPGKDDKGPNKKAGRKKKVTDINRMPKVKNNEDGDEGSKKKKNKKKIKSKRKGDHEEISSDTSSADEVESSGSSGSSGSSDYSSDPESETKEHTGQEEEKKNKKKIKHKSKVDYSGSEGSSEEDDEDDEDDDDEDDDDEDDEEEDDEEEDDEEEDDDEDDEDDDDEDDEDEDDEDDDDDEDDEDDDEDDEEDKDDEDDDENDDEDDEDDEEDEDEDKDDDDPQSDSGDKPKGHSKNKKRKSNNHPKTGSKSSQKNVTDVYPKNGKSAPVPQYKNAVWVQKVKLSEEIPSYFKNSYFYYVYITDQNNDEQPKLQTPIAKCYTPVTGEWTRIATKDAVGNGIKDNSNNIDDGSGGIINFALEPFINPNPKTIFTQGKTKESTKKNLNDQPSPKFAKTSNSMGNDHEKLLCRSIFPDITTASKLLSDEFLIDHTNRVMLIVLTS
jgi:hypothetical protein